MWAKAAPPPPPPPAVGYVTVTEQAVTLASELPGRTAAVETSEVRPQVNGLVLQRLFTEGDSVAAGQPLYRIDPQPYQAQAAAATAALARARAGIASSAALARRYGELVAINAIAKQDYENAQTAAAQARADVAAQQAALRTAQIDLARTTIRAAITGRIGRSTYTSGALVTAAQTEPLATIQRLDPIFIDIQQSSADLLTLRRQILSGQVTGQGNARVRLKLEDGSSYGPEGRLRFADVSVDPTTGTQVIRASFPNPDGLLLPGMYVRAAAGPGHAGRAGAAGAAALPSAATSTGKPIAFVVGRRRQAGAAHAGDRPVAPSATSWLVTSGLAAQATSVVVEGGSKKLQPRHGGHVDRRGTPGGQTCCRRKRRCGPGQIIPENFHGPFFHRPPDLRLCARHHRDDRPASCRSRQPADRAVPGDRAARRLDHRQLSGCDAQTLENTTTQIIEQQMKGIDHLRLFLGISLPRSGSRDITLTFEQGTNPDIAQVQVQNKLQAATPLLPQRGAAAGRSRRRQDRRQNFLLFVGLYSENGKHERRRPERTTSPPRSPIQVCRASPGVGDTQTVRRRNMRCASGSIRASSTTYALTTERCDVTAVTCAERAGLGGSARRHAAGSEGSRCSTPRSRRRNRA